MESYFSNLVPCGKFVSSELIIHLTCTHRWTPAGPCWNHTGWSDPVGYYYHKRCCDKPLECHLIHIVVFTQQKGVKQKYILCISGLVVYRQYIHNCSSQIDPHLAHDGESGIRSSAPLACSALLTSLCYSSPLLSLGSDPQIRSWLASGESTLSLLLLDACC